MKSFVVFLVLLSLAATAQTTNPFPGKPATSSDSDEGSIKVNVKLVNVFATVSDSSGRPLPGLAKENFALTEDGIPQSIAVFSIEPRLPLSVVLAVDTSLSTRDDLKFELASAQRFAAAMLKPGEENALAFYQFDREVRERAPFTKDLSRIERAIRTAHPGSSTSLYDAIYLAAESLEERKGRRVMVIITDGGDTTSSVSYQEALRESQESEALIYSIIIVPIEASAGRNTGGEHALIQLSHDTGGMAYYADSTPELDNVFRQIAAELQNQYLLAYYPKRRLSDSDFRRIEVRVSSPVGAVVRNRTGYYTSASK